MVMIVVVFSGTLGEGIVFSNAVVDDVVVLVVVNESRVLSMGRRSESGEEDNRAESGDPARE